MSDRKLFIKGYHKEKSALRRLLGSTPRLTTEAITAAYKYESRAAGMIYDAINNKK